MTKIYFRNAKRQKVFVEVSNELALAYKEVHQKEWRNEKKELYYRGRPLDTLTDDAIEHRQGGKREASLTMESAEDVFFGNVEREEHEKDFENTYNSLTLKQTELVKLLEMGMTIIQIAQIWNKHHTTIFEMRKALQKKFQKFL
ncbi:MAG: hypothetical protein FWE22_04305 [Firmicutes bacterium]|nr:hypothetical protein [Bacillota bacterium]